ncbi:SufS family cysteine desulfurase [Patescibacteria group bacterium]|nr:SufS family cysteine desulfurase [Patescibacteria group bacterium]
MDLHNIRQQFPLFNQPANKDLAYFDNAASTQKPEVVLKAMDEFYRTTYANVHRGVYKIAEQATAKFEGVRAATADYLGAASANNIVFTRNATSALNLLAQSYSRTLKPGDEVVLTEMEHHANLVPWQQAAKHNDLVLKFLPVNQNGRLELDKLSVLINKKTKVVSLTAMSNVLGTMPELKEIISLAKSVGARVIVDAAQALPHKYLNVKELDCDALVFTAHKFFGPSGLGILYASQELLEIMPPIEYGGHMIAEVNWYDSTWAEPPTKFEAGTPPIAEVIGWGEALNFIKQLDWVAVEAYEKNLTEYGLKLLTALPGLTIVGPEDSLARGPVFAFSLDKVHPHDLGSWLDSLNIAVRSGHHCTQPLHRKFGLLATTRASLSIYNTPAELDRLADGIKQAQKMFT